MGKGAKRFQKNIQIVGVLVLIFAALVVLVCINFPEAGIPGEESSSGVLYVTKGAVDEYVATIEKGNVPISVKTGEDGGASDNQGMDRWQYGIISVPNARVDVIVVVEFTDLKATPYEIILYPEEGFGEYLPFEAELGRISFKVPRLTQGEWIVAMKLPEGKGSLGMSEVFVITEQEYEELYSSDEDQLLPRDETGGAITVYL